MDRQLVDLLSISQPEMDPEVANGQIALGAHYLSFDGPVADLGDEPCTYRRAIRLNAFEQEDREASFPIGLVERDLGLSAVATDTTTLA